MSGGLRPLTFKRFVRRANILYQVDRANDQHPERYCWFCIHNLATTRDHFLPRVRGGGGAENSIPSCRRCNQRKADLLVFDWVRVMTMKRAERQRYLAALRERHEIGDDREYFAKLGLVL